MELYMDHVSTHVPHLDLDWSRSRHQKKSKKLFHKFTYCYTFMLIYGSKFFDISKIGTFWSSKQPISDLFKNPKQGM